MQARHRVGLIMQRSIDSFFGSQKRAVSSSFTPHKQVKNEDAGPAASTSGTGSPVKAESPAKAESPVKAENSVKATSPAKAESPVKAESPAKTESPTKLKSSANPESPVKAKSPVKTFAAKGASSVPTEDGAIEYLQIASTFSKIEATAKRLEITKHCADLFHHVLSHTKGSASTLSKVVYLCINRLGPDYEGLELGLGESLIIKALAESTGRSAADVKKQYVKLGDLGQVALASKRGQAMMFSKPRPLTVEHVFAKLKEIATRSGKDSQQKKISIIKAMLVQCRDQESKYLVRSLEGKLRIGLAEKTVLIALSQAFMRWEGGSSGVLNTVQVENGEEIIKEAYSQVPNYELVIEAVLKSGLSNLLENVKLTPGVPLKPMLAKPTKSVSEVLDRFQNQLFTCEYKYDGERAQVHCANGKMQVYSRNMEDMSERYPDIIEILPTITSEKDTDFILDCEAVAWDHEQHKILPFQVLSTRKRKDVLSGDIKVKVQLFAFDILYFNGKSLLTTPLNERREFLKNHFIATEGKFALATHMNSHTLDEIQTFLDQSVKDNCEGLMIKALEGSESNYEPSKRSMNWLKLKKDYLDGIGDSLDLVVVGAYYGRGKRTNWYGGFLLACYNPDTEEYETVCKIGTGFSEQILQKFYDELSPLADTKPKSYILHDTAGNQQPDVWFEPKFVWEVLTADLSLSPVYQAGKSEIDSGKGISLRFPRFVREREDKGPEDSTSTEQIVNMYHRQFENGD